MTGPYLWSPDGHQFLIVGPSDPREVTVIDDRPGHKSGLLRIADLRIFSVPKWAGPGTIVAVIGDETGDSVALLDVDELEQPAARDRVEDPAGEVGSTEHSVVAHPEDGGRRRLEDDAVGPHEQRAEAQSFLRVASDIRDPAMPTHRHGVQWRASVEVQQQATTDS